ncbi:MAG: PAS domain S-box protein [Syntrophobacteraceae bacterium]|nr:PAS domain S-box protein [Syntrophobacteraceae bacterium]
MDATVQTCLKVLLIEDDEDDYIIFRDMLSQIGSAKFLLQWANTYDSGLREICRANHDVYLLDYRLDKGDGLELLREATARGGEIPIILLTGHEGYDVDIQAMSAGASDYLVKGHITPNTLERAIRYSVAQKRAELELRKYRNHLEQLVQERTRELETANDQLRIEIDVRRMAERAIRQLAAIVQGSDDAIISLTLEGIVTSWNKAAEIIYGYAASEAIGQRISINVPPEYFEEMLELLARIGRGERIFHHETIRKKKNGEYLNVSLTISPLRDDDGTIIGVSTIARDITERERVRKEKEKLIRELQDALANVKTLRGLFPICAWCKKIRDDQGYWQQIEAYIRDHSDADFSHCICPVCAEEERDKLRRLMGQ